MPVAPPTVQRTPINPGAPGAPIMAVPAVLTTQSGLSIMQPIITVQDDDDEPVPDAAPAPKQRLLHY